MISATNLQVTYGDTVALSDLTMEIPTASSLAVIGPNGSGKSTLLGVLAGIITANSGSLIVACQTPSLVLQSTDVDNQLPITVRDTVSLARYPTLGLFKRFSSVDREATDNAMRRLSIQDLAKHQFYELSGGQRQRVLVAQGIAQETDLLLLDEPISGLDISSRETIFNIIDEEITIGRTVVLTTHYLEDARRCDQVLLLDTTAVAVGTPEEVLTEEHLRRAFGGRFIRVGNQFVLDDPHHSH